MKARYVRGAVASNGIGGILTVALAAALAPATIGGAATARASQTASPVATPATCAVTQPNGEQPPHGEHVFGRGPGGHGHAALWTNLWTWGEGVVLVPPTHILPDGALGGMKWPWWRGVSGRLTVTRQRLDAPVPPLRADIPDGYGAEGFQPSGLIFPTPGCWHVTGEVGEATLTFVVLVQRVDALATPTLPAGSQ